MCVFIFRTQLLHQKTGEEPGPQDGVVHHIRNCSTQAKHIPCVNDYMKTYGDDRPIKSTTMDEENTSDLIRFDVYRLHFTKFFNANFLYSLY